MASENENTARLDEIAFKKVLEGLECCASGPDNPAYPRADGFALSRCYHCDHPWDAHEAGCPVQAAIDIIRRALEAAREGK